MVFKIAYRYCSITKLCREQAAVIANDIKPNVFGIGLGERHAVVQW
jgi:hypothetical protein